VAASDYQTDFAAWAARTAGLIRAGRFGEIDAGAVAEEIEDLGKRERSAARSQLLRLLVHQIKRRIQPEKETASWRRSILDSQTQLLAALEDSPSLEGFLVDQLDAHYCRAVHNAQVETRADAAGLPANCPFTLRHLIETFDLSWPA
jgi:hypothetical protein